MFKIKKLFLQIFSILFLLNLGLSNYANAQTATIVIDSASIKNGGLSLENGTYGTPTGSEKLWTQDGFQFGLKQVCNGTGSTNTGTLQAQASNGVIYNITALPGRIVSVEINQVGTPRQSTLYGGDITRLVTSTTADYTASGTVIGSASTTGWTSTDLISSNATFFAIKRGTSASYIESIIIVYETSYNPNLNITQPINGDIIYNTNINVDYNTNMTVGVSDYHVKYTVNSDPSVITNDNPIAITLIEGQNTIVLELIDNSNISLNPVVADTITITKATIPDPIITIASPTDGSTVYTNNINVQFTAQYVNLGTDAFVRSYVNGTIQDTVSSNTISAELIAGYNTIVLELLDENQVAFNPMISDTIVVNYEPYVTENTMYKLVTSNSDLVDNGKYLFVGLKDNAYYAMSYQKYNTTGTTQTNRAAYIVLPFSQDTIVTEAAELISDSVAYEFILESTTNGFAIKDNVNNQYMQYPSNNNLTLSNTQKEWIININNNVAEIVYYDDNTRKIQFYSQSALFGCYTSVQSPIYLFKAIDVDTLVSITSPQNNSEVTTDFLLTFNTFKFTLSDSTGTGDGHAHLLINGTLQTGVELDTNSVNIALSQLNYGSNIIRIELVKTDESSLSTPVYSEISVIYNDPSINQPEITITSPTENETISTINAIVVFDTIYTEIGYTVKYILDSEIETLASNSNTIALPSPLTAGNHTIIVNLYDNSNTFVDSDIVNFIAEEPIVNETKLYQLVTSQDDLFNGGRYLVVGRKESNYFAMGVQQTSNRWGVSVNNENGLICVAPATTIIANDTVNPYEIKLISKDNAFAMLDIVNNKFLTTRNTGTTGNHLKLSSDTITWNIAFDTVNGETDEIIAECIDTISQSFLRFNDNIYVDQEINHHLFSAYVQNSNLPNVYFYRLIKDTIITITSPENNEIFATTNNINIDFSVSNFTLNTDGIVKYTIDDNIEDYTITNTIQLQNLSLGEHNVILELLTLDSMPFTTPKIASVTFTIVASIEIINTNVVGNDINLEFTVTNVSLGTDSYVKFTLNDEEIATDIINSPIEHNDLEVGSYIAILELVDTNYNSLNPIIADTTNFIIMSIKDSDITNINIYPNPSTDYIIITSDKDIDNLTVYNNLGQIVKEINNINSNKSIININSLQSGIYTIKIESKGQIKTKNFIVE